MTEETVKIYAAFPTAGNGEKREKIINILEKENYLNCKFWEETEENAKRTFDCYYNATLTYPSQAERKITLSNLSRIYSTLEASNEYATDTKIGKHLKKKSITIKGKTGNGENNISLMIKGLGIPTDIPGDDLELLQENPTFITHKENGFIKIEEEHNDDKEIYQTISNNELAGWYKDKIKNEPISEKIIAHFKTKKIFANENKLNKDNLKIIRPLLDSPLFCLTYKDAKDLFFPEHEILGQLKEAFDRKEIRGFYANNNDYYFLVKDLVIWLMKGCYLEDWLTNDFEDWKIESLIEDKRYSEASQKNQNTFNWQNFYSVPNGKIIEDILDRKKITLNDLGVIFSKDIWSFFSSKNKGWQEEDILRNEFDKIIAESKKLKNHFKANEATHDAIIKNFLESNLAKLGFNQTQEYDAIKWSKSRDGHEYHLRITNLQRYDEHTLRNLLFSSFEYPNANHRAVINQFIFLAEDYNKPITNETFFKSEVILNYLIVNKILPYQLYRLPRFSNDSINFEIIPNYYQELDNIPMENLIKSEINYMDIKPPTLTYEELKRRWVTRPEDEIYQFCISKKLGAYIYIDQNYVKTNYSCYLIAV